MFRCIYSTYQKDSSIKLSMEQADAIRTPSSLIMAARSMPRSSDNSICRKSPTLCETGRSANWHFSLRLGSGTVMCGSPLIYFTVTSVQMKKKTHICCKKWVFTIYFINWYIISNERSSLMKKYIENNFPHFFCSSKIIRFEYGK